MDDSCGSGNWLDDWTKCCTTCNIFNNIPTAFKKKICFSKVDGHSIYKYPADLCKRNRIMLLCLHHTVDTEHTGFSHVIKTVQFSDPGSEELAIQIQTILNYPSEIEPNPLNLEEAKENNEIQKNISETKTKYVKKKVIVDLESETNKIHGETQKCKKWANADCTGIDKNQNILYARFELIIIS